MHATEVEMPERWRDINKFLVNIIIFLTWKQMDDLMDMMVLLNAIPQQMLVIKLKKFYLLKSAQMN